MTCFELCESKENNCKNTGCRQWIQSENNKNCTILASRSGQMSLQDIGDILGVTRMRICQIEKKAINKLNGLIEE